MKYSAVMFDLDGTLTESGIGIRKSFEYALEKLFPGKKWDEKLFSGIIGPPLSYSFSKTFGFDDETTTPFFIEEGNQKLPVSIPLRNSTRCRELSA